MDSRANPPRSIWTHPYEDEKFLSDHPDIREKVTTASTRPMTSSERPPNVRFQDSANPPTSSKPLGDSTRPKDGKKKKKGLIGALKEKAGAAMAEHNQRKAEQAQMVSKR